MKITFLPKTKAGKWSVGILVLSALLFLSAATIPGLHRTPDFPDIIKTPLFASMIYLGFASAIIAAFTGLKSVIKSNERSILVFLTIPLGILYFCGIIVVIAGLAFQALL